MLDLALAEEVDEVGLGVVVIRHDRREGEEKQGKRHDDAAPVAAKEGAQGGGGVAHVGRAQFNTLSSDKDVARRIEHIVGLAGQDHHGGGGTYQ